MNSIKPHLNFLMHSYKQWMLFIAIFIGIQVFITIIQAYTIGENHFKTLAMYKQQIDIFTIFLPTVSMVTISTREFGGAMSIRGDRMSFIKASIIYIIMISLSSLVFAYVVKFGINLMVGGYEEQYADIGGYLIVLNNFIGNNGVIVNLLSIFSLQLVFCSLGFMFGAIFYNLDIKTSVILFIGLPIIITFYIVKLTFSNSSLILRVADHITNIGIYLCTKPLIFYSLEVVTILISLFLAYLLLRNAPIKEYAYSKWKIRVFSK